MIRNLDYEAVALTEQGELRDVIIRRNGKDTPLLGPAGAKRENDVAEAFLASQAQTENQLTILLGGGLGHCLKYLLAGTTGPVAVVDSMAALRALL